MIDFFRKILGKEKGRRDGGEDKDRDRGILVATCALFLEMAGIDGRFTGEERERILSALQRDYGLPPEETETLLREADKRLEESIDLWQFTRVINEQYSAEQKIRIIELLWKLVYADGVMDKHENYLIHKLSSLLHLPHKALIDAKLRVLHGGKDSAGG